ncbi:sigma-70 family RNA polymerase sigma factor [Streptomyces ochraceiscleroticus]|uniref:Sigma-70 family RNA polymerase sigma factor n=1 Tax=Streptomyces ochraceiscleroticus TaxID=47761 RepID=A0ABW1MPE8_9ACTN|nr:sigma-70 family RNA polymerase sigma factor [Streptomyces ochraceiscleroticus]
MTDRDRELIAALRPLLAAEVAAEAPAAGADAEDIEQAVWARLLRYTRMAGPPAEPGRWLRRAVRAEVRGARRRARREIPYDPTGTQPRVGAVAEPLVLDAERRRALLAVAEQLPGRCPELVRALLSGGDPTYREVSSELGMSQGSMGPLRSRCLACLRRMLTAEVGLPELRGKER